jgi:Domain of unknown function (DUF932)
METSTLSSRTGTIDRQQLALVPTPQGTATHRPIPHYEVVSALVETLGFRHIGIVKEQYACSKDGMKMYGTLDLDIAETDFRFSIGVRNAHDKSMRLAMTVGYRVFCCDNGAFSGDFQPVLAKHSKHFNLIQAVSVGVDDMQRNFKPMVEQVERWRGNQISDAAAKLIIYRAFVEAELDIPHHLDRTVHGLYFNPQHEEGEPARPQAHVQRDGRAEGDQPAGATAAPRPRPPGDDRNLPESQPRARDQGIHGKVVNERYKKETTRGKPVVSKKLGALACVRGQSFINNKTTLNRKHPSSWELYLDRIPGRPGTRLSRV